MGTRLGPWKQHVGSGAGPSLTSPAVRPREEFTMTTAAMPRAASGAGGRPSQPASPSCCSPRSSCTRSSWRSSSPSPPWPCWSWSCVPAGPGTRPAGGSPRGDAAGIRDGPDAGMSAVSTAPTTPDPPPVPGTSLMILGTRGRARAAGRGMPGKLRPLHRHPRVREIRRASLPRRRRARRPVRHLHQNGTPPRHDRLPDVARWPYLDPEPRRVRQHPHHPRLVPAGRLRIPRDRNPPRRRPDRRIPQRQDRERLLARSPRR